MNPGFSVDSAVVNNLEILMKKLLARLFLVGMISLWGIWGVAHADGVGGWITDRDFSQVYYGVSIGDGSFEIDGSDDSSAALISGTAGLSLIDFLGVEFQVGTASDDSQSLFSESQLFYGAAMLRLGLRFERVGIEQCLTDERVNPDSLKAQAKSQHCSAIKQLRFAKQAL